MLKNMSAWRKSQLQVLLVFVVLLGSVGIISIRSTPPIIQMYMTVDSQHPATVRFVVGHTNLLPPIDPLAGLKCNGVAFKRGYPEQDYYVGMGWYADVPAILPGESYHCTVSGLFSSHQLNFPMRAATVLTISAPANDAPLARNAPFDITFTCGDGTPYGAAYDRAGHESTVYTIGCGDIGTAHFRPVARDSFAAGPGIITLKDEQFTYDGTGQDWPDGFSIIYVASITRSVQWQ